ncbi:hypothetical protein LRS05_09685 [Flavobacterium sp. J372]|uniref:hypothetical protein n=1 Tax=Flavobacterium sp. J372 TaxID=2898436 RepID=UPI002151F3AA|nr:hypothetical protein [Flavobacterium sp. J372]MCR5862402.1 hypothetical protein [Flavobacterium sp. J372]
MALITVFIVVYISLFYFGISIYGDYADYIIFSLAYLYVCMSVVILVKKANVVLKVLGIIGAITMSINFLVGLIGIIMFIVISQDYEADKVYKFNNNNKHYSCRRYTFGFATLDDTRYTFETYRQFKYLPLEIKIDKTDFFANESDLDFTDAKFSVAIKSVDDHRELIFRSSDGGKSTKMID